MRIIEEVIKDVSKFYIQESADEHYDRTRIDPQVSWCTLGKFEEGIYRGSHSFDTLDEAKVRFEEVKTESNLGFVPNRRHSKLETIKI